MILPGIATETVEERPPAGTKTAEGLLVTGSTAVAAAASPSSSLGWLIFLFYCTIISHGAAVLTLLELLTLPMAVAGLGLDDSVLAAPRTDGRAAVGAPG